MTGHNENTHPNDEPNNFGVPQGYFQKSASAILNKVKWEEEHVEFPALLKARYNDCFSVPQGYFNRSAARLELLPYEKLSAHHGLTGDFTVPEGYFAGRTPRLLITPVVTGDEELEAFGTLRSIERKNNFTVQDGYFAENEERLRALLSTGRPGKVMNLFAPRSFYAAAALIVMVLGFWIYAYYFSVAQPLDCGTIACLDKADILRSGNFESVETEELYQVVNPEKLEQNLEQKINKKNRPARTDSSPVNNDLDDIMDGI